MSELPLALEIARTARGVVLALVPLAVLFAAFQLLFLLLPRTEITRIANGALMASIGLFLFLLGVSVAEIAGRLVVWDVDPVPGFRAAVPIDGTSVENALASLTVRLLHASSQATLAGHALTYGEEACDHVVLSA